MFEPAYDCRPEAMYRTACADRCGTRIAVGLPIFNHGGGWICTACHYDRLGL